MMGRRWKVYMEQYKIKNTEKKSMINKRLVKGICGLAMAGGLLMGMISPAMEAEARVDYADIRTRSVGGKVDFWVNVSGYNAGYYCLYGYLNRTSDNKVCIMDQRKGTGNIHFSTHIHSTDKSDGYTVGSFYARGIEEMLSVK